MSQDTRRYSRYFYWILIIHCTLWVIAPTIMRYALPHDTIEGFVWGQTLEWGYDKNPWMNAWLTRLGYEMGGTSGIGIYALSSLFVALSLGSVWQLAQKALAPRQALVATLVLVATVNYTLVPQGFNDNVIELGLWPFLFLCFYRALEQQNLGHWILVGLVAALGMMTKYYTAFPLLAMLLFIVLEKRESFTKPGIYISLLVFLLVLLPHIIWLSKNDWITIKYALNRTNTTESISFWKLHFYYPLQFAIDQILDFLLPLLIIFLLSFKKLKKKIKIENSSQRSWFNKKFIFILAFFPYFLTVFLAMILGWRLYSEWGVPLISLWGIAFLLFFKPSISEKNLKKISYFYLFYNFFLCHRLYRRHFNG